MNIYEKIVEIRKSIEGFTKDKKGFNFSYVTGGQVLAKIQDKMDELGVVLEPHIVNSGHEKHEYINKGQAKIDFVVWGDMEYHWVNAEKPDDRIVVKWGMFGQQGDISQAFGSGLTYSERYFLLKYFGKPTDEDDPDKRNYNDKKPTKQEIAEQAEADKAQKEADKIIKAAASMKITWGQYIDIELGWLYRNNLDFVIQLDKECEDVEIKKAIAILKNAAKGTR